MGWWYQLRWATATSASIEEVRAVIANRYDVMAKYAKSVRHAFREEFEHLKHKAELEARFLKSSRKLMQREPGKLEASHKQQLVELFQHSKALETMHQMRVELGAIWERSHSTRDQLLQQVTEGSRAALGNLRAAAETIQQYPDMEPARRERFFGVIGDEAQRLSRQLDEALAAVGEHVALAIDAGPSAGVASTIVSLATDEPRLVREGAIAWSVVQRSLP